jgi:hypothetical protein
MGVYALRTRVRRAGLSAISGRFKTIIFNKNMRNHNQSKHEVAALQPAAREQEPRGRPS